MAKKRSFSRRGVYIEPPAKDITRWTKEAGEKIAELSADVDSKDKLLTETYQHMVRLFTGTHSIGMDESRRYVAFDQKSGKTPDIILRVMGMLLTEPRSQYLSAKGSVADDAKADRIERHLNAIEGTLYRRNGLDYRTEGCFWQLLVGSSYIIQSHDSFYWDKNELRRRGDEVNRADDDAETSVGKDKAYNERVEDYQRYKGPPVRRESLDPRTVWPIRTNDGIRGYVRHYRVQRYDFDLAFAKRGKRVNYDKDGRPTGVAPGLAGLELPVDGNDGSPEAVDYFEYIDDEWIYYVVGDNVIDKHHHKGGTKIFPAYGLRTGLKEPHLAALGILWAARQTIPQQDFINTLWANKAFIDVFPQLVAQLEGNDELLRNDDGTPMTWDITPGTIVQLRGKLTSALADAASGVDFRAFKQELGSDIDAVTISGIARGQAGAQQPGYSINQLSQAMRTLWKPIITSAQLQHAQLQEHYLQIRKQFPNGLWCAFTETEDSETGRRRGSYEELKADDIDDYYRVECLMEPELPVDKQGNMLTWWKLYQEGGATWEEFTREGMSKPNPIARQKQIRQDQFDKAVMPKVIEDALALGRAELGNEILKARGLDKLNTTFGMDLQALKAARQGQTQQPGAGGGAMPPLATLDPNNPPASPIANGGNMPAAQPQGGDGIQPTFGANPNNPAPGPRLQ